MKIEAGPHRVLAKSAGGHIPLGTDDCFQRRTVSRFDQLSDLPANAFERQAAAGRETFDLGGTCQYHHRRTGQNAVVLQRSPLAIHVVELQHVMVGQDLHVGVQGLKLA